MRITLDINLTLSKEEAQALCSFINSTPPEEMEKIKNNEPYMYTSVCRISNELSDLDDLEISSN